MKGVSWSDLSAGADGLAHALAFAPLSASLSDPWLALAVSVTGVSLLLAFVINRQQVRPY